MKISAVLIGKNESAMLPRVLGSLQGIDEIIYCDTGSTDNSVEVAHRYVKQTYFYQWDDSFARARNAAKTHATGDWILSIDCDEILHSLKDVYEAAEIAESNGILGVDVKMIPETGPGGFLFPRLFKNDPRVWWEGNVHNHLSIAGEEIGDVMITYGYSPAHDIDPERSLRILEKDVLVDKKGGREVYYLGREYLYRARYEECVQVLGKYVQTSVNLPEKADAFLCMSRAYWQMKDHQSARDAIVQALIINANFKEAILFMADLAGKDSGNERWEANAAQWLKMAETADNRDVLFVRAV